MRKKRDYNYSGNVKDWHPGLDKAILTARKVYCVVMNNRLNTHLIYKDFKIGKVTFWNKYYPTKYQQFYYNRIHIVVQGAGFDTSIHFMTTMN